MKPAILGAIAFVVSAAASTGAKVAMTPPKPWVDPAHADSTKKDSTKTHGDEAKSETDTAAVASGEPVVPPAETQAEHVTAKLDSLKGKSPILTHAATPAAAGQAHAAPNDTMSAASERRLAKVFTSMDAKAAAKVLEHMTDGDVHVILGYIGVKQAAQIMAALPPERVAKLSKLEMGKK